LSINYSKSIVNKREETRREFIVEESESESGEQEHDRAGRERERARCRYINMWEIYIDVHINALCSPMPHRVTLVSLS
jgi:hypothetical protein